MKVIVKWLMEFYNSTFDCFGNIIIEEDSK